jgi:hypothetical protein
MKDQREKNYRYRNSILFIFKNMLDRHDATKMLLTVLSDSSVLVMDLEILNQFLLLGIKLLEGGNNKIQKNIYNYCITF